MSGSSRPVQTPNTEEEEKTQVLKAGPPAVSRTGARPSRQPGLPPPLVDAGLHAGDRRPAARGSAEQPVTESKPPAVDVSDDEPTRIMSSSEPVAEQAWLVSDGLSAPIELSHTELLAQLKAGSVSAAAFAWQKGMKEWKKVTDLTQLAVAVKERLAPGSSAPRASSPKANSSIPIDRRDTPKLGRSVAMVAMSPSSDSRRDTPKLGHSSILLSGSLPTAALTAGASVSRASGPASPPNKRGASAPPGARGDPDKAFSVPRPAAGRKPTPHEPVAKAGPLPAAPTPSVVVAEKITTHRDMTEPARSRLTWAQLQAAGRPPSILLWLLGAGGWAVAGVLAGLLIARGNPPTPLATPAPLQSAALPPQPAPTSPAAIKPVEPATSGPEKEVAPLSGTLPLPVPEPALPSASQKKPPISPALPMATAATTAPIMPPRVATPETAAAGPAAPLPEQPPANDLNSPGF